MSQKRYDTRADKKEILKGLEFFESSDDPNFINPREIKDLMDKLELREKMGFIYDLIDKLCSNKEVRRNGGLTKDEFMNYLEEKMNDTESKEGIHTFYDVFTNSKDETLPMTNFCRTAREINDYKKDQELKELLENADMTGKELDFDEFYEIMKSDGGNNKTNEKKYQPKTNNTYNSRYNRKYYGKKDDEEPKEDRSSGRYNYKNKKTPENNNSSIDNEPKNTYSYKRVRVDQTKNSKYDRTTPEEKHVEKEVVIENEGKNPLKYERGKDGNYVRVVKKTEISEEPNKGGNERVEKKIVVAEIITTEKEIEEVPNNARYRYKNNRDNQDKKDEEDNKHYSYKVSRRTYTQNEENNNDGSDSKRYHRRYRASNRSNEKTNESNNNNNGNATYNRYRRKV